MSEYIKLEIESTSKLIVQRLEATDATAAPDNATFLKVHERCGFKNREDEAAFQVS